MRRKAVQIFLHIVVWLAAYLLPYFITYGNITFATIFNEPGGIIHAISTALLVAYAYLNQYVLVPFLYLQRKYVPYLFLVFACLAVVIWLPMHLHMFEPRPASSFPPITRGSPHGRHPGFGPPGDPHLSRGRPGDNAGETGIFKLSYNIILFIICTFASVTIRQQRQLLEVQKEKLDAELGFLKAQINPHFLFNTLNSIYALSIRKSDDTPKAIIELSELMRYILKDADADTVGLDKELNYINNYVELQKRRLGHTVQINYTAPAGIVNRRVAPLILMSFIENAFKHGVNPDEDSAISITINLEGEQLHLLVANNKVSSVQKQETMGIGLKNAVSRLEHLYPGKHKLTVEDNEKIFSVHLILHLHD